MISPKCVAIRGLDFNIEQSHFCIIRFFGPCLTASQILSGLAIWMNVNFFQNPLRRLEENPALEAISEDQKNQCKDSQKNQSYIKKGL